MSWAEFYLAMRLVLAQVRLRPGRLVLTSLSTIAATCIVVWVVSGYDSLMSRFGDLADDYMGRYHVYLIPEGAGEIPARPDPRELRLSPQLVESLQQDPAVAILDTAYQTTVKIRHSQAKDLPSGTTQRARPTGSGGRLVGGLQWQREASKSPLLVGTDTPEPPTKIVRGRWIEPGPTVTPEAVLTHNSAEILEIDLGDVIVVAPTAGADAVEVQIVGIAEQPDRLPPPRFIGGLPPSRRAALQGGPANDALYVSTAFAEKITAQPAIISYAAIGLKRGIKASEFVTAWSERFAAQQPAALPRTADLASGEIEISTTLESARAQAMSAMGIALLAALFIIFTTLSMGVHERIRQFAMLRAIALTKAQIGAMIVLESLILGLIGWAGGLLAGWGLIWTAEHYRPDLVAEGVSLGIWSITLAGICALGGALAASVLPAWRATTVSPLEAMVPTVVTHSSSSFARMTLLGLVLIPVNPIVVFYLPIQDARRYGISAAIGCTSMAIGFILLAPWTVWVTERFLGPVVARLLCINPKLLASQLTSNLWRTVGTAVSLTLGLGLFVTMQTWGYSMLEPFVPGDWVPDLLVRIAPVGVASGDIDAMRQVRGIVPDQFAPLVIEQVKLAGDPTGARLRQSSSRQETCVMVGVDPAVALGGEDPLFDFRFEQGTRQEALSKLKRGRYCLVPDHFNRESGLGVGDRFAVFPNGPAQHPVDYEIAGVVSMQGWHWMAKIGFARTRVAGLMIADHETIRRDFNTGRAALFWMNTEGTRTADEILADLEPIARRNYDERLAAQVPLHSALRGRAGPRETVPLTVTFRTAEGVRAVVRKSADGIIWILSQLPLVTLAVTSIGVINTVISSVRARQWDLGVLRAIGITRFGLFRLIIAEAILVGLVACVLSLGFGVMAGYCGTGVTRYINIRGGQLTTLIIPWGHVCWGFAATLTLCLLAALVPAFRTGRTEPLALLQSGRTAI